MEDALKSFLSTRGLAAGELTTAVGLLRMEAPWLLDEEEVAEDIGLELLSGVLPANISCKIAEHELVEWHNTTIRRQEQLNDKAAEIAYASLVDVVSHFGVEDGLGGGDFWVVEDSFSEQRVLLTAFKTLPLPAGLDEALVEWLARQSTIKALAVISPEGDVLAEYRR